MSVRFGAITHLMGNPEQIARRLEALSERRPMSFQAAVEIDGQMEAVFFDEEDVVAFLKDKYQFGDADIPDELLTMDADQMQKLLTNDALLNQYAPFIERLRFIAADYGRVLTHMFGYLDERLETGRDAKGDKITIEYHA